MRTTGPVSLRENGCKTALLLTSWATKKGTESISGLTSCCKTLDQDVKQDRTSDECVCCLQAFCQVNVRLSPALADEPDSNTW